MQSLVCHSVCLPACPSVTGWIDRYVRIVDFVRHKHRLRHRDRHRRRHVHITNTYTKLQFQLYTSTYIRTCMHTYLYARAQCRTVARIPTPTPGPAPTRTPTTTLSYADLLGNARRPLILRQRTVTGRARAGGSLATRVRSAWSFGCAGGGCQRGYRRS